MASACWREATHSEPCAVCTANHFCTRTTDGKDIIKCRHQSAGAYKSDHDKLGEFYLHQPNGSVSYENNGTHHQNGTHTTNGKAHATTSPEIASPDDRHRVYDALLARLGLHKRHKDNLESRGLTPDAIARGCYATLPDPRSRGLIVKDLRERFSDETLLRVPGFALRKGKGDSTYIALMGAAGMLIPARDLEGKITLLKYRLDEADHEDQKYLTLSSAKHGGPSPGIAVHAPLGTPATAEVLRLTEGELKSDLIRHHLPDEATLSIPGVTTWRESLDQIKVMEAKTIRLAFDADWQKNPKVARALADCADVLVRRGLAVEVEVWDTDASGDPKGLDDLLAAGGKPRVLAGEEAMATLAEVRQVADTARATGQAQADDDVLSRMQEALAANQDYFECRNRLYGIHRTPKGGLVAVRLAHFTAKIVEQVRHDDGSDTAKRLYMIEGRTDRGQTLPRIEVPADKYGAMDWVAPGWGAEAIINAGRSVKDNLRTAIQCLSLPIAERSTYGHTGWRKIDGRYVYLHAGGAIGPDGSIAGLSVIIPNRGQHFVLPEPPEGEELKEAVFASFSFLNAGPRQLMYPLLAAAYRAAMGPVAFSIHLTGDTSSRKSTTAAMVQQHFGASMVKELLPCNWKSTTGALEVELFAFKDAVAVVDEFKLGVENSTDLMRKADRVLRGASDGAGRSRLTMNSDLMGTKYPRGLVFSTGEEIPIGESLRARVLTLNVARKQMDLFSAAHWQSQKEASQGLYARSMAGFIRWLAQNHDDHVKELIDREKQLCQAVAQPGQHGRTSGIIAALVAGLERFLEFAVSVGAITAAKSEATSKELSAMMKKNADAQDRLIQDEDQVQRFMNLLHSAVGNGMAHMVGPDGDTPRKENEGGYERQWGWKSRSTPSGTCIGMVNGDNVYLDPEASLLIASEFARKQGQELGILKDSLYDRLREKGVIKSSNKGRTTVLKTFHGGRKKMLHVDWNSTPDIEEEL